MCWIVYEARHIHTFFSFEKLREKDQEEILQYDTLTMGMLKYE